MTNALHPHDRQLDRHQDSIMSSLTHRLAVARANDNIRLVALLEQEKQQVASERAHNHVARPQRTWWETAAERITHALFGGSSLQVCEVVDGRDRWWVASNPQTGQVVYADSEAEMRLWIEANYQGR